MSSPPDISLRRLASVRQHSNREEIVVGQPGRRWLRTVLFLLTTFLLGISLYFPLILGFGDDVEKRLKTSALAKDIYSPGVDYFTVGSASLLFPVITDYLLDVMLHGVDEAALERGFFAFCVFFTFLTQFISLFTPYAVTLFGCSLIVHVWLLGSISVTMETRYSGVLSFWKSLLLITVIYIYCFCSVWHFAFNNATSLQLLYIFRTLSFILILIITLIFWYQLILKFRLSGKTFMKWVASTEHSLRMGMIVSTTVFIIYVTYLVISMTFDIASQSHTLNSNYVVLYFSLSIMSCLAMTFIPQRMTKAQTHLMLSELQMKKSFVRFISHELRTPLSIVITGLDLLSEQVMENASKYDILSTVQDIKQPCITGVDILNELLEFEKIESGDLVLCKSLQDPVLFLDGVISPFTLVARQKNIELKVRNEISPNSYQCEIDESKVNFIIF